jgi:hypothetical protein
MAKVHRTERLHGMFERSFALPTTSMPRAFGPSPGEAC